jgi:hypothetical protein
VAKGFTFELVAFISETVNIEAASKVQMNRGVVGRITLISFVTME